MWVTDQTDDMGDTFATHHQRGGPTETSFTQYDDDIHWRWMFTGECEKSASFVAVLGASNLTYAEPVVHPDLPTWVGCHICAFEYFGGTTPVWVPDNRVTMMPT
jgi:transposase